MGSKINFRHNIMTINSIEEFVSIRGGLNDNLRDVYFVRGIGEPVDLIKLVKDVDEKMGLEMLHNRLKYFRINCLPPIFDMSDSNFYSEIYDQWNNGRKIALKHLKIDDDFSEILCDAYRMVIGKYIETRSTVSESMIRNFATKILYWLDTVASDFLSDWNVKGSIKVIASNVLKEQEYLFFYFLTLLGCDVLLIENKNDVNVSDTLKCLSYSFILGRYGHTSLSEYVPYVPQKAKEENMSEKKEQRVSEVRDQCIKINIPKRAGRSNKVNHQSFAQGTVASTLQRSSPSSQNREKTFEELAQLASSIVLIAVHDHRGDIIGTGSGIMIGCGGYILTNNHVASGGRFYSIRIEDDDEVYETDEVIKYNSNTDLAVIRIKKRLKPLPIYRGNKGLVRGQKVVAIGSPLGLFNSVSDGIISGFRKINDVDMIQFTAPISHGSSGGAVLNMQGEVIGISTAGIDSGQNINLAVGYENILLFAGGFVK